MLRFCVHTLFILFTAINISVSYGLEPSWNSVIAGKTLIGQSSFVVSPGTDKSIDAVVFGESITVWSGGWVKGSSDTAILIWASGPNAQPQAWCDNWPQFNLGLINLRIFPMFFSEGSYHGTWVNRGTSPTTITIQAYAVPDGASVAVMQGRTTFVYDRNTFRRYTRLGRFLTQARWPIPAIDNKKSNSTIPQNTPRK